MDYTTEQIYDMYIKCNHNKTETANKLGINRKTVQKHINRANCNEEKNIHNDLENVVADKLNVNMSDEVEFEFSDQETTEEDLFKKFNLDSSFWQIERITHNEWETPIKMDNGDVVPHTNKQSKVIFKKILKDITLDIIKEQYKLLPKKYESIERKKKSFPCMYEIAITDHHFAKLAWDMETGESYDIKIAKKYYINAIKDLLNKASHLNIEKILMPIGNDLFNFDGIRNETSAGTPQDSDSRWTKVFKVVSETLLEVIDICRTVADVDVVIVPGNHDKATCFYLGEFLYAWYRLDKHVNIDNKPTLRKYYQYGRTLIGLTHGSEEKHSSLPLLMSREAKEFWATSDFYEYQIGHWHRKKMTEYISGDVFNGVQVRVLPSLCGTDAWHYSKGYVQGLKSALGIVYDKDEGQIAEFITKVVKDV